MTVERFSISSFSFPGRSKPNQDSLLARWYGKGHMVLAIADGMGGKPGGSFASKIALQTIDIELDNNPEITIEEIFSHVKKALVADSILYPAYGEMATTLSVCLIKGKEVTLGHVGDCRVYQLRGNGITTQTKDQTEVQRLLDDGILPRHMAKDYPRRNILLSVMNATLDYTLQKKNFSMKEGDRLVLMSDGAYTLISKSELRDISVRSESENSFKDYVLELIRTRPIKDDYSAIFCRIN
ncbi:PP2C family protein-serine/threonine phosphatase [Pseudomonas sp. RL_105y_Pfl1_103]|uniref:PP2C family protein-serine/threonine phosphatase n=1 Tax=Pseudomonas sp. RL_105y_Pfl1_103 TaxID=3088707 RepID=UPI0030DD4984